MLHNQDWTDVDLESIEPDALPVTSYKPTGDRAVYDASYTQWGTPEKLDPARNHYRVAWRKMAANTGERTLISALIPPATAHIEGVRSLGFPSDVVRSVAVAGVLESILSDFVIRAVPKNNIVAESVGRLPFPPGLHRNSALILRILRLNCLTDAYADLWESVWEELAREATGTRGEERVQGTDAVVNHPFTQDRWKGGIDYPGRPALGDVGPEWTPDVPLRRESDRRQALLEIDVLVAMSLGISVDELATIYRTQFPVLYGYDRGKYLYDANGRVVPTAVQQVWRRKGEAMSVEERTATHPGSGVEYTYVYPFRHLDREADFRTAFEAFTRERSNVRAEH